MTANVHDLGFKAPIRAAPVNRPFFLIMAQNSLPEKRVPVRFADLEDYSPFAHATDTPPDPERIAQRAYEIWDREGRPSVLEWEHWVLAEWQILGEFLAVEPPDCG
jgi:hypothetical protein